MGLRWRIIFWGLVLVCSAACGGNGGETDRATALPDDTQVRLVEIIALRDLNAEISAREALISPDAATIVWDAGRSTGLCLYTLVDAEVVCAPYPDPLADIYAPVWSPDSRYIAFTENLPRYLRESDIWIFTAADRVYTNRTDDGLTGTAFADDPATQQNALLDLTPTWSPNGDLYFFRSKYREEDTANLLYRIPASDLLGNSEPEQVLDFTAYADTPFPVYSRSSGVPFSDDLLSGGAAVSPDRNQLAVLIRPADLAAPEWGVWLFDLEKMTATQILELGGSLQQSNLLPKWSAAALLFTPAGLAWTPDGKGLLLVIRDGVQPEQVPPNVYYLDLASGALTPMVDISNLDQATFTTGKDADGYDFRANMPVVPVLSPSGNALLYTALAEGLSPRLSLLPVPPPAGGATPIRLGALTGADLLPAATVSIGADGNTIRLIMFGLLITLERIDATP